MQNRNVVLTGLMLVCMVLIFSATAFAAGNEVGVGIYSSSGDLGYGTKLDAQTTLGHLKNLDIVADYAHVWGLDDSATATNGNLWATAELKAKADYLGVGVRKSNGRLNASVTIGAARSAARATVTVGNQYGAIASASASDSTTKFAWQPKLSYELGSNVSLTASYLGTGTKATSGYNLGVAYRF
ncbi:MAG: hypothetical protein US94_C0002G0028 [Berkelbacteria bacterium GW2011_GWB1_38_5]|uniref:Outer membrane protein beta-barrel domain-containing protein n=2 Tax=Candidatus Berkelbacteria TaxID=1618330 RepID=A0A0G0LJ12_9BACT|nr:MAG: hypothetical protein US94_C0002G0028 [Berkelbacteria bacterium GW2011_GWB1_38_5]KKQ91032.1 MAG: hypothetical protein UT15_C0001G0012 [Berkelbacteria bacterium GW2011_GWA1_39_10]